MYSTLLVWYRQRGGVAKLHGEAISLQDPPPLSGSPIEFVDYRPEIGERRIQRFDGPAYDMTEAEVAEADAWLRLAFLAPRPHNELKRHHDHNGKPQQSEDVE